jgi:hypothetical protein
MAWAFTTVTATVNTTATTNGSATTALAVTFTGNLTTATPALLVGALMTAGNAVFFVSSVTNVTNSVVTLVPQTGVAVPTLTASTSVTFQNPINQTGTDNTIGTALSGLATSVPRTDVINAFIDNAAGYASGATSMVIDNGSGAATAITPTIYTSFINNTLVHYVVGYNAGTRTITFSPALNASLADNARLTLFTQGVLANVGNAGTGPDIYTVHGTRVRVSGTLAWNSWAEQLVLAATCPATVSGFTPSQILLVAQFMLAGTLTLAGTRSSWGTGSGSICPSPALIINEAGSSGGAPNHILGLSGSTASFTNAIVHCVGSVDLLLTASTFTNATFSTPFGPGPGVVTSGSSTYSGLTVIGYRWNIPDNTSNYTLSGIRLDGAGVITQGTIVNNITITLLDLVYTNYTSPVYQLRVNANRTTLAKVKAQNLSTGTANIVGIYFDGLSGGNIYFTKNVSHVLKNIQGDLLSGVKIASTDVLNNVCFNWFTSGQNNTGLFLKSDLSSIWDGASVKSYLWTTNASGIGAAQEYLIGTVINPNQRAINLSAFVDNAAGYSVGATSIVVDNGAELFPNPAFGTGATQINGSFFHNNTRHLITAVTTNTNDYTLTISPGLTATLADNAPLLIHNVYRDIRSKATIAAYISNTGGYAANATTLLVDNGAGARTTLSPQVDTNFIWNGTFHNITAVGTGTANKWQLTIEPPLSASITNGQLLTLQNVAGVDTFDFYTSSYLHVPQQQELTLTGTGTLTNNWQLLNDASITQTTKATVDAYTTITTAAQFYDRAKSWWYENFETLPTSQQGAVLVTRAGTVLNAGAYNITLNNIAGAVFAFASNTITIKTATFTDTLTTTGTITLSQTGTYSAGIVPATGTVAIAAAGTYDLAGWTFASGATISNTSGEAVIVWLTPSQVANATGSGSPAPTIIAKPQPLTAPNFADGTRAYAARVQSFTIASTDINASTDTITLGNDSQGRTAAFATAAPWTQVRFSLNAGATLPTTTGSVLRDGGFYYWSGGQLYTSLANIPSTPVDFTSQGTGNFTLLAETELFNTVVSGGAGLSQSLVQSNGIAIRLKATYWVESSGTATASVFYDSRDSLLTWSDTAGLAVGATIGPATPEAVHEAIVAASGIQSNKYGLLTPANTGSGLSQFTIALEGVGTLQINSNDTDGVELLQNIFLWWCWVRSTEAGIRIASYDTLQALSFTSYQAGRVEVENTNSTTPLTIAGGSITFPGTSTGIAATSFAINLNADVQGVVAITGLSAADLRSAVGLTSANLDSQLSDITALVL